MDTDSDASYEDSGTEDEFDHGTSTPSQSDTETDDDAPAPARSLAGGTLGAPNMAVGVVRPTADGRVLETVGMAALNDLAMQSTSSGGVTATRSSEAGTAAVASSSSADTSILDFKTKKKVTKHETMDDSMDDESEICPICFDPWTNTGSHRLASLRCGHLFGKSCIQKWLKGHPGKCPKCNAKAQPRDIRVLFARSIKMVDTSERDRALEELEKEREARKKAELEAARARLNYQMALSECNEMKEELQRQKQQLEQLRKIVVHPEPDDLGSQEVFKTPATVTYLLEKHVKVWEAGGCRVMAYSSVMTTLCVSQPSSSPLFPGFGIKKINSLDFKSAQYIGIHSKAIRDLSFNSKMPDSLLLSCSMDKTVKMTSLASNQVIHSYECASPVWSCAWNLDDRNCFYTGQQNGAVNVFDIRYLTRAVSQLNMEGSRSPVVSIQYMSQSAGTKFRSGGLIVGQLDHSAFYEKRSDDDYKVHLLPLEANLTSLSLEESTGHLMATYRPTSKHPYIRHQVCELVVEPVRVTDELVSMACSCNPIYTLRGGSTQKLLTKNRLMMHPENYSDLIACTGDEASQSFHLWLASSGQFQQKVASADPVLDLCPIKINNQSYLVALTDKQISVYKYHSNSVK